MCIYLSCFFRRVAARRLVDRGVTAARAVAVRRAPLDIHYRGVQWEGGAVDWGSII